MSKDKFVIPDGNLNSKIAIIWEEEEDYEY